VKASRFFDAQKAFDIKEGEEATPFAEYLPQGGYQPNNLFQLKEEMRGAAADRNAAAARVWGREQAAEEDRC